MKRGNADSCIELSRFADLAGAVALSERLPAVLTAGSGVADVTGGTRTLDRLSDAVLELAENTVAHSHQVSGGAGGVVGYYMAQLPKRGFTFVAVGDSGDGIPRRNRTVVLDHGDNQNSDVRTG